MFLGIASLVGTLIAVASFFLLERKGRSAWHARLAQSGAQAPLSVRIVALSSLFLGQAALLVMLFPLVARDSEGARIPLDRRAELFLVAELLVSSLLWISGAQLLLRHGSVRITGRLGAALSLALHGALFGLGVYEIGRVPLPDLRPLAALFILGFPTFFAIHGVALGVVVDGFDDDPPKAASTDDPDPDEAPESDPSV